MNARRRPVILSPATLLSGLALAALLATAVGAEERVVGKVTSVVGEATAQQPDGEARALACGDPIYEGDHVATAVEGRVDVMMGDTLAHLSEDSQLLVERTPAETPGPGRRPVWRPWTRAPSWRARIPRPTSSPRRSAPTRCSANGTRRSWWCAPANAPWSRPVTA
jgi:hypothetical protein